MSSDAIASSVAAAEGAASTLKGGLEEYRSFKLGAATSAADGMPPSEHDAISGVASGYCCAYAAAMERDATAFAQIGIRLDEADAMAAAGMRGGA